MKVVEHVFFKREIYKYYTNYHVNYIFGFPNLKSLYGLLMNSQASLLVSKMKCEISKNTFLKYNTTASLIYKLNSLARLLISDHLF